MRAASLLNDYPETPQSRSKNPRQGIGFKPPSKTRQPDVQTSLILTCGTKGAVSWGLVLLP